jgi:iron complex transport system permease protein
MLRQSWDLNVLSLGEDVATSLGVNSKHLFTISMVLVSIATASIVSFTGVIGFVCLVAPHLTRLAIGNDHRFLLPCSAAIGACLLLCSDTVARMVILPSDLPIGIVTSLIGVPFFIYLILRKRQRTWF